MYKDRIYATLCLIKIEKGGSELCSLVFVIIRPMIEIFDTHTHLNVDNFAGKEQEEIDFAAELGVIKMNIVGFDKPTIDKSLALSEKYDQLYSTMDGIYGSRVLFSGN